MRKQLLKDQHSKRLDSSPKQIALQEAYLKKQKILEKELKQKKRIPNLVYMFELKSFTIR